MTEPIFDSTVHDLTSQEDAMTDQPDTADTAPAAEAATIATPAAPAALAASNLRTMIDSAYPLHQPPSPTPDIVLSYAGGDTVHPWTPAEIAAMPERFRWPCWVRSNPDSHDPAVDAAMFVHWLQAHGVPKGTAVILDLETAVNGMFVDAFNRLLRAAGYLVAKYGSQDFIWQNPKTDGGTFLALPGDPVLTGEGDEVARQYAFEGGFDLSVVLDSVPLWDVRPPRKPYLHHADGTRTLAQVAHDRNTTPEHLEAVSRAGLHGTDLAAFEGYLAGKMPIGLPYCTSNP